MAKRITLAILYTLCTLAWLTHASQAEEQSQRSQTVELLLYQVELARTGNDLKPTTASQVRLIGALEKLVGPLCMQEVFTTYQYDGPGQNERCKKHIEELLSLLPTSPLGLCGKFGLYSQQCLSASSNQLIEEFDPAQRSTSFLPQLGGELALHFKLAHQRTKENALKIQQMIEHLKRKRVKTKKKKDKEEISTKLRGHLYELVNLQCSSTKTDYETKYTRSQLGKHTKTISGASSLLTPSTPTPDPLAQELNSFLEEIERNRERSKEHELDLRGKRVTPDPRQTKTRPEESMFSTSLVRVRYISAQCISAIKNARFHKAAEALGECFQFGTYSPQCVSAVKHEREEREKEALEVGSSNTPSYSPPKQGLEEF
jgi:hypothetical protein